MIVIQEIHEVIGERELDFEDSYRDVLVPALSQVGDARLLWFAWAPHGGGRGYEAATVIAANDFGAWDRHVERTRYGDLADWATDIDAMRYGLVSSVNVQPEWSPLLETLAGAAPSPVAAEHTPTLLRLDTLASNDPRALDRMSSLYGNDDGAVLALAGVWEDPFGALGTGAISLLYRVDHDRVGLALADDDAAASWSGSLASDASLAGDVVDSRLLRTVRWSPLT